MEYIAAYGGVRAKACAVTSDVVLVDLLLRGFAICRSALKKQNDVNLETYVQVESSIISDDVKKVHSLQPFSNPSFTVRGVIVIQKALAPVCNVPH